ncbi:hypothetical protein V6N12_049921 [Hibiscus sabdariffa]|uniref:Uncharacterized protein n=1 Tax=Hibiscus sabdariffa TaxID=183260 RepID=A0ABR2GC33_9ROSI
MITAPCSPAVFEKKLPYLSSDPSTRSPENAVVALYASQGIRLRLMKTMIAVTELEMFCSSDLSHVKSPLLFENGIGAWRWQGWVLVTREWL